MSFGRNLTQSLDIHPSIFRQKKRVALCESHPLGFVNLAIRLERHSDTYVAHDIMVATLDFIGATHEDCCPGADGDG